MKRILSFLLAVTTLVAVYAPYARADIEEDDIIYSSSQKETGTGDFSDYIVLEGGRVFYEDFEAETVDSVYLPSNEFSVKQDPAGGRALYINAIGKNIATGNFGPPLKNYLVEADVMLTGCNAGSNGGFFISARKTSNTSPAYNLLYTDVNNYDWDTKTWNSSTAARDRLIIARSRGSFNIGTSWFWTSMSNVSGALDLTSRSFSEYVHMKMYMSDTFIRLEMYTKAGEKIISIEQSTDEVDTIAGGGTQMARIEQGNIQLGAHGCSVWYDNISVREISVIKSAQLMTSAPVMLAGDTYDIWAESERGEIIPFSMSEWEYDSDRLDITDGKITPKAEGEYEIKAKYNGGEASVMIKVQKEYAFSDYEIIAQKTRAFRGERIEISIKGSYGGHEYTVSKALDCESGAGSYDGTAIIAENPGSYEVRITYNGITKTLPIYISAYTGANIRLEASEILVGESSGFSVWAMKDGEEMRIPEGSYSISADDGLILAGERVDTERTGIRRLYAEVDTVKIETELSIMQITEGIVIDEDFEDSWYSEFFDVPRDKVITDTDGNKVYAMHDEFSPFFGDTSWRNYRISGRVKILNKRIEENRYNTSFSVYLRQNLPQDPEMTGGHKGIPAVYCMDKDFQYLRIGSQSGAGFAAEENVWYDFSAESFDNQFVFTLGDRKTCFSVPINESGGFFLNAENTEIYLDDIKVERFDSKSDFSPVALEVINSGVRMDKFANRQLTSLFAVRAVGANGEYRYVSAEAKYEVSTGNAQILSDSLSLRIASDTTENVKIGIKYNGLSAQAEVVPVTNYATRTEYLKATQSIRNKNFCYKLLRSAELLGVLNTSNKAYLSYVTGLLALQPKRRSYDREINWLVDIGKYESSIGITSDADFVINILLVVRYELKGILNVSGEVWQRVDELIKNEYYGSGSTGISENHRLMNFADGYLVGELFPKDILYGGKTGAETNEEYAGYIIDWINYRYKYGMMEYDSTYIGIDIIALETIYNYTQNESMKRICGEFLNWLYADSVQDSIEDRLSGAHGRTYFNTNVLAKFYPIAQRFENEGAKWTETVGAYGVQPAVFSFLTFEPHDAVYAIAEDRSGFINKERHKVYQLPDDEAVTETLCKYTYVADDYSIGSIVNYENPFSGLTYKGDKYYNDNGTWIAGGHQELSMTAVIRGNDKCFLTFGQPGPLGPSDASSKHSYFSGFYNYPAFNYMQHKNTVIGLYYTADDTQRQYVHCYVPKAQFERVDEEDGWIFLLSGGVYTAVRPLKAGSMATPAYRWGDETLFTGSNILLSENEILIEDKHAGFVMQMTSKSESGMDFDEFKSAMKRTKLEYSLDNNGTLNYTTFEGNVMKAVYDTGENSLNGVAEDYSKWKLFDSEYMQADYGDGYTEITAGGHELTIMPARLVGGKAAVTALDREIEAISETLQNMSYVDRSRRLDELRLDILAENIIYAPNEYTADILWNKLIAAIDTAMKKYDFDTANTVQKLERYKGVKFHGEYIKRLLNILDGEE